MRSFLLFQLCAPLASFGEVAGYTQRTSATRPTRSQLLGLVAAAMAYAAMTRARARSVRVMVLLAQ